MADDTLISPESPSAYATLGEQLLVRGGGVDIIPVEKGLSTEEMLLNIGPQHPSTHGVLRIVLELDGEVITRAEPVIGYMHRAAEKLSEVRDVRQIGVLMNRHDWLSSMNNELGFYLAVEKLVGVEVPDRASWIRMLMVEWNRVLNHLMFMGSYPLELGAMTPMFYAFREREMIQHLMESATGGRMHFMFCRVGGLKDDLPRGFLQESATLVTYIRKKLREFEDLILGNEIIHARTKKVGILDPDVAMSYGVSGPVLQASKTPMDARKDEPYLKYDEVDFDIPVGPHGDSYDRLWVLVQRVWQSVRIIEQIHDRIPPGPYVTPKVKPNPKIPEGEVYVRTENPLGLMSYYLVGDGTEFPYRLKMRTASFSNVSILPYLLPGALVADLISILGSIFFVVGDVDR